MLMAVRQKLMVLAAAFACGLALQGCSRMSVKVPGLQGTATAENTAAPAEAKDDAAIRSALIEAEAKAATYKISPADLLEVSVYQEKDLEKKVRVGPDGMITFPLLGAAKVGGLSVPEAEEALTLRFRRYLTNPQVSIFVREYGNKIVYVLGEVQKPGSYALPTEATLTILEAISLAGGFTQYAAGERTRIIRRASGKKETININVPALTKGQGSKDALLQPNDVVFVPERMF